MNKARSMELQAIHQYLNQHYNLDNMDYGDFALKLKLVGLDEMRHAEKFADRIEELGGQPTVDPAAKAIKGQKVEEVFGFDANLEDNTIATYNEFLAVCRENGDSISVKLFELIIDEEQIHYNYFDNVSSTSKIWVNVPGHDCRNAFLHRISQPGFCYKVWRRFRYREGRNTFEGVGLGLSQTSPGREHQPKSVGGF